MNLIEQKNELYRNDLSAYESLPSGGMIKCHLSMEGLLVAIDNIQESSSLEGRAVTATLSVINAHNGNYKVDIVGDRVHYCVRVFSKDREASIMCRVDGQGGPMGFIIEGASGGTRVGVYWAVALAHELFIKLFLEIILSLRYGGENFNISDQDSMLLRVVAHDSAKLIADRLLTYIL